jgi:hypothetical protein
MSILIFSPVANFGQQSIISKIKEMRKNVLNFIRKSNGKFAAGK